MRPVLYFAFISLAFLVCAIYEQEVSQDTLILVIISMTTSILSTIWYAIHIIDERFKMLKEDLKNDS